MAMTRKFLTALGIEPEKIDEIIEAHSTTVDGLKDERDNFKKRAEEAESKIADYDSVKSELDDLRKQQGGENVFETRYNELKTEFDNYKQDVENKAAYDAKEKAFVNLLKESGVSEKRIDSIVKISKDEIDSIEFLEDGKVKDSDSKMKSIKDNWSDFIVTQGQVGANVPTPIPGDPVVPKGVSRAEQLEAKYHANLYGGESK